MHRWSKLFIPTLREAPADAEVASHKFLVRAGYIRQLSAGIYSYLFLAQRTMQKIETIVRQEMDTIGQELYLPALNPREVWEASGRWATMGDNLFRLKDRKGADLCLGMTHEEVMTDIARKELRSYKQLPQIWYQIQTKFRDEPRPKSGLLRVRQFTMKDSYSFDIDRAGLDKSFELHDAVYRRIFDRCGIDFVAVEADSGAMGGSQSQEFMVYTDAGEDFVASCSCGYAANLEKATSKLSDVPELEATSDHPEEVATPNQKSIEEVAAFLGVMPSQIIKSYFAVATYKGTNSQMQVPIVIFLRGDHEVNEAKTLVAIAASGFSGAELRPMQADEIREIFSLEPGFIGPLGISLPTYPVAAAKDKWKMPQFYFDLALKNRKNMICGANKTGFHLRNVTPESTNLPIQWIDLRSVAEGEGCPRCGQPLKLGKTVEIGHIFKLGYKYSESMGAKVLDKDGKEVTIIMGCYGIGMERILTAAVELHHDDHGFWLAPTIAPFTVVVTPTNTKDEAINAGAEKIARELEAAGYDVLLDDRAERPGVKFKDADLVGIPFRVNIGKKLAEGNVELVDRATTSVTEVAVSELVSSLQALYNPRA